MGGDCREVFLADNVGILRSDQFPGVATDEAARIIAAELIDRRRDIANSPIGLEMEENVGRMLRQQAIALFAQAHLAMHF